MNVHQFSVLSARSRSLLSLLPLVLLLFLAGPLLVGCGEDEPGTEGEVGEVLEGGEESDGEVGESDEADSTAEEIAAAAEEAEELANEEGRYLIRLNPYAGEKYSYRVVRDQKVTAGEYTTRQKQTFDVDMAIESRNDDGSSVLGITYRRVRAEFTAPSPVVDSAGYTMVDCVKIPERSWHYILVREYL